MLRLILLFILLLSASLVSANDARESFYTKKVATGLGIPWGMAFVDERNMLVTDRSGHLYLVDVATGQKLAVSGLPKVYASGQGGLLDIAIAPDTPEWIYITYSKETLKGGVTVLARVKLKGQQLKDWQDLLVSTSASDTGRHYGSRIAFDGKGHVFFSIGDRGVRPNGQDTKTHAGSILRLKLDGSVPADNPFVNDSSVLPEIWSYGHRNPQGLFYDTVHNELWSIEHGPRGGDEINLILKGHNYGWPVVSHGKEYWGPFDVGEAKERKGMESPRKVYTPSIAPSGLVRYTGKVFKQWQGNLFTGALKLQHINRVVLAQDNVKKVQAVAEHRLLESLKQRIRNIIEGPDGLLYFSTDSGDIYRIVPKTVSK